MDVKTSLDQYHKVTSINPAIIQQSIEFIKNLTIEHEFRTTVVKTIVYPEDFGRIGRLLKGAKIHYLQKFQPSENILDPTFKDSALIFSDREMLEAKSILEDYVKEVIIR